MSKVYVFTSYGGPENQELQDREIPKPGPGEMLIAVKAAGVNPVDWKIREGRLGTSRPVPMGLGLAAAGVVQELGDGVTDFAVGDEVIATVPMGNGGYAEHAIVRASGTVKKPEGMPFNVGAAIPVSATTAYNLTHSIELGPGQTMLVLGAGGGVGLMALQIAKVHKFGAIGVASEGKRALIEATGAQFVPSGPDFAKHVAELAPDGVDLVVDLVGGEVLRAAVPLAKSPNLVISAADPSVVDLGGSSPEAAPDALEKITSVIDAGLVDPNITATFPLERASEALALVEAGHSTGKTIIEVA